MASGRWLSTTPRNDADAIDCSTTFGHDPKRGSQFSPKDLVAALTEKGCRMAASISLKGVYYDYEEGNRETLEAALRLPFIIPAATLDPRRYYGGRRQSPDLEAFRLMRLFPDVQGWPLDYAPLDRILEVAANQRLPVMFPAAGPGRATPIARLAARSGVPLILTSIGYGNLSEALALLQQQEELYISTEVLNTPDGVELVCDEIGPEKLVFGSGFPTTYFDGPRLAVERAQIPRQSRDAILRGNITRILGLK